MNILEVRSLGVNAGKEQVIKDLTFNLEKGEFLTVMGPNGAGKTTLLRALLGLIPHQGEIVWEQGLKISYLPQRFSRRVFEVVPISVKEFFKIKKASEEKITEMLGMVSLNKDKILEQHPSSLSSGEFQRMLIAWSLVDNPQVLLFDEPTGEIDIGGKETVYSLLSRFWKEKNLTVIIVTHEMNVVYAYSDNVLCLSREQFCYGKPDQVLNQKFLKELYKAEIGFYKHKH